jgi:hypothetical protein
MSHAGVVCQLFARSYLLEEGQLVGPPTELHVKETDEQKRDIQKDGTDRVDKEPERPHGSRSSTIFQIFITQFVTVSQAHMVATASIGASMLNGIE